MIKVSMFYWGILKFYENNGKRKTSRFSLMHSPFALSANGSLRLSFC
jgi:hypothetical protein